MIGIKLEQLRLARISWKTEVSLQIEDQPEQAREATRTGK